MTYQVKVWTSHRNRYDEFTLTGKTAEQVAEIRIQVRRDAPTGASYGVTAAAE